MQPTFGLDLNENILQRPNVYARMCVHIYAAILAVARDGNALEASALQRILDDVLEILWWQLQQSPTNLLRLCRWKGCDFQRLNKRRLCNLPVIPFVFTRNRSR